MEEMIKLNKKPDVLYYNDYVIGTYRNVIDELVLQCDNAYSKGDDEYGEIYGNYLEELIGQVHEDKNVHSDTLICIKETPAGSISYNIVELECV